MKTFLLQILKNYIILLLMASIEIQIYTYVYS